MAGRGANGSVSSLAGDDSAADPRSFSAWFTGVGAVSAR